MDPPSQLFGGRYRADHPLGKGGFGVVFHATDVNTGRAVALKVLRSTDVGSEASQRFTREARIVQQLSHPNTVRLYDFGSEADGTQFIVYELIQGETLSRLIRQGPVPPDRTIRIATQVLKALHEAHQLGIIHRDIKPANIMLLQFAGDRDVVKLLDFGIAKPTTNATHALTNTGVLVGTPRFMSPEQVRGDPVGPSSDVYSLAVVLAEMLSGQKLLEGSSMEILLFHISPDPLQLPPAVATGPLGPVLRRALEKDERRRYPGALQMLADLEVLARGASMPQHFEQPTVAVRHDAPTTDFGRVAGANNQETAAHYPGNESRDDRTAPGVAPYTASAAVGPHSATVPAPYSAGWPGPHSASVPGPHSASLAGPYSGTMPAAYGAPADSGPSAVAAARDSSRLPWIVAGLALLALVMVGGAAIGGFWYVSHAQTAALNSALATGATVPVKDAPQPHFTPAELAEIKSMDTGLSSFDAGATKAFLLSQGWKFKPDDNPENAKTLFHFSHGRRLLDVNVLNDIPPGFVNKIALIQAKLNDRGVAIFGTTVVVFLALDWDHTDAAMGRSLRTQVVQYLQKHAKKP